MNKKPKVPLRVTLALAASAVLTLSACHVVPYKSKFMCEKSHNFGQCMDVQAAYEEAVAAGASGTRSVATEHAGTSTALHYPAPVASTQPLARLKTAEKGSKKQSRGKSPPLVTVSTGDLYRDAEYRELAGLIEAPVTPLIRPPRALRTLIVAYTAGNSLYMSRYIVYFADEARFVLGDYLNPADTRPTVYPMGRPAAKP